MSEKTDNPRAVAERLLEREERESRDRRLAELEREEQVRRDRERREAEQEAAHEAARRRVEELDVVLRELEVEIGEALSPAVRKIAELRAAERERSTILHAHALPGRYDLPRMKALLPRLTAELEKAASGRAGEGGER